MNNNKAMLGYLEGFAEDAKPFLDLLKALGYFTEDMQLTEKGKKVLHDYWDKQFKSKGIE